MEEIEADGTNEAVIIGNGCVTAIADNTRVAVYALDGHTVADRVLANGESIALSAGVYIARINGKATKIMVH